MKQQVLERLKEINENEDSGGNNDLLQHQTHSMNITSYLNGSVISNNATASNNITTIANNSTSSGNSTARHSNYSNVINDPPTLSAFNSSNSSDWNVTAYITLEQTRAYGRTSRLVADFTLLGLERYCALPNENASSQTLQGIKKLNTEVIPTLQTKQNECETLLKSQTSYQYPQLRSELESASSACSQVILSQEKLVDVASAIVIYSNASCSLLTPSIQQRDQYNIQANSYFRTASSMAFAILGGLLGLILMVFPSTGRFESSTVLFVISAAWIYGYCAYLAAWYGFQMDSATLWMGSSWWRDYYACYLIGLAGWFLGLCFFPLIVNPMTEHPWIVGIFAGFSMGGLFGIELNTLYIWYIGYQANLPNYFTLSCCIACGAGLFALIFSLWYAFAPFKRLLQHLTAIWLGSYLFIKMIGILVGNYPNEFLMFPPLQWETFVYIGSMWLLAIIVFIIQFFLSSLGERAGGPSSSSGPVKRKKSSPSYIAAKTTDESTPLIASTTSAAEARNRGRKDTVVFGNVQSLRNEEASSGPKGLWV